jgi:hypothetical protein
MSLTSEVLQVLYGPNVARIRFRFPNRGSNVAITQFAFYAVLNAIVSGRIIVQPPTDLPDTAGAQYNDVARDRADGTVVQANTLEIVSGAGPKNEAYIVHECLHAYYDLTHFRIDGNAEEASGYVCSALYLQMTDPSLMPTDPPQWGIAGRIAQTLLRQYENTTEIPMVDEDEWARLRVSIALRPAYAGGPASILGIIYGQQYTHDG